MTIPKKTISKAPRRPTATKPIVVDLTAPEYTMEPDDEPPVMIKPRALPKWAILLLFILFPNVVPFILSRIYPARTVYDHLVKPKWAPPGWLFGVAWTVLYSLMGYSSYLIFSNDTAPQKLLAYVFYISQLIVNYLWTPTFFGKLAFCEALVIIAMLWSLVLATAVQFATISYLAAGLLVPYLLWGAYATALNEAIVQLNGCTLNGTNVSSDGLLLTDQYWQ